MKDADLFKARNEKVREMYNTMTGEGYSHQRTLTEIEETYFIKPRTIYAILSGEYERRKRKNNAR